MESDGFKSKELKITIKDNNNDNDGGHSSAREERDHHHPQHPLENEVILNEIFKLFPVKDLRPLRLVSPIWRNVSFGIWRSSVILKLTYDNESELINKSISLVHFIKLFNFTCVTTKPFRHLQWEQWPFKNNSENLIKFWRLIGAGLKTLTLTNCIFGLFSSSSSQTLFDVIHESCPELEHLEFDSCFFICDAKRNDKIDPAGAANMLENLLPQQQTHPKLAKLSFKFSITSLICKINWTELFSNFPNLTKIQMYIPFTGQEDVQLPKDFISQMELIKMNCPNKFPTGLVLNTERPYTVFIRKCDKNVQRLKDVGIRLEKIKFDYDGAKARLIVEDELKAQIEFHSSALTDLIIKVYNQNIMSRLVPHWNVPFGFKLDNLTNFEISSDVFCQNLLFLKDMPNLKSFSIVYLSEIIRETHLVSQTPEQKMENVKLEKLTTFIFPFKVTVEDLNKLVKWIPNITKVEIYLNDELFPILCENWRALETLKITGSDLTDEGLIGLAEGQENQGRLSNIAMLNNLKAIKAYDFHGFEGITDFSVYNGFLKMARLNAVTLSKTNISNDGWRLLRENGITVIRLDDDDDEESEDDQDDSGEEEDEDNQDDDDDGNVQQ